MTRRGIECRIDKIEVAGVRPYPLLFYLLGLHLRVPRAVAPTEGGGPGGGSGGRRGRGRGGRGPGRGGGGGRRGRRGGVGDMGRGHGGGGGGSRRRPPSRSNHGFPREGKSRSPRPRRSRR